MKVLILHPFLATHYKNKLFSVLHEKSKNEEIQVLVLQFFVSESSRKGMENQKIDGLDYPYKLLFDKNSEEISNFQLLKKLIQEIRIFKPDILNITGFYTFAHITTIFYAKLKGIKIIISNDSTKIDNTEIWWKTLLKKAVVKISDGFFCYGTRAVEYMISLGANPKEILSKNCAVVDNQRIEKVFLEEIQKREIQKGHFNLPKFNFIYIGRFLEIKNLETLINAFKKVKNVSKEWGLILLGEGETKSKLQEKVRAENSENVFFIDGQNWFDIPKYLALADVFVLPSKSEPWGLVVNEAMICKMPVLVSETCGSAADLVEKDKNGYSFNPFDEGDLEKKLQKFIENKDEISKMGKVSYQKIQQNSPKNCAAEMIAGFRKIAK